MRRTTAVVRSLRRAAARKRRRRQIRAYLSRTDAPALHLGAGHNHLPGWLNTDRDVDAGTVQLDATKPFPLPERTFHRAFSEHLVEHLPRAAAAAMLRECHRVLVPGGTLRTATPDLAALMSLVDGSGGETGRRYARWLAESYFAGEPGSAAAFAINQVMRGWGHRFLYDEQALRAVLADAGFTEVRRQPLRDSPDPALRGLEDHGIPEGNEEMTRFETMCLEARKPA